MHGTLDYGKGRIRIHHVQQNLNHLITSGPKNRSPQNFFRFRIDGDLDETLSLTFLNGPAHLAHRMFRRECSAPGLPYFSVCHAASPERRISKQSVCLDSVRHAAMICIEEIVSDDLIVII